MDPLLKLGRIPCYSTGAMRNVEDWRKASPPDRALPWRLLCVTHGTPLFVDSWERARTLSDVPGWCSQCRAFDRRCAYCPSDREAYLVDSTQGFTPSVGMLMGREVCERHRFGAVPEGVDYIIATTEPCDRLFIEVYAGPASYLGDKVAAVEWASGDNRYWLNLSDLSRILNTNPRVTVTGYAALHNAVSFAMHVAGTLNAEMDAPAASRFATWEQIDSPQT